MLTVIPGGFVVAVVETDVGKGQREKWLKIQEAPGEYPTGYILSLY
ncbi:hypothetical protein JWH17_23075 [Desulfobulbus marinus]|nr:hypothetical protein [Desulfogranum marinum]